MRTITIEVLYGQHDLIHCNIERIKEMLEQLSLSHAPENITVSDVERILAQKDFFLYAAISREECDCNKDKIIGLGIIFFRETLMGYRGYVDDVVVHGDYRGKGIAKSMGHKMIKLAEDKEAYKIELRSGNQRKAAHKLWISLGFKAKDSTPFDLYL